MFLEPFTIYNTYNHAYAGPGWIGGSAPVDPNPNSPDGRTRVEGEPAILEVRLLDGKTRRVIARQRSKSDGTWRFNGLKLRHHFAVEFVNQDGHYKDASGQPYNSFIQDFIYAMPPEYERIPSVRAFEGSFMSVAFPPYYRFYRIIITQAYMYGVAAASSITLNNRESEQLDVTASSASSEFQGGLHPADKAFDGDPTTWWASSDAIGLPAIIYFNGDSSFEPFTLTITSQPDPLWGPRQAFRSFTIEGSMDNENWSVIKEVQNEPEWGPGETRSYILT